MFPPLLVILWQGFKLESYRHSNRRVSVDISKIVVPIL